MDPDQLRCQDMDTDLYKAVMTGDMGYFDNPTHDRQSIPSQATSQQQNVLHIAADFKSIDLARNLVTLFPVLLTRADLRGNTPLHIASKRGCSEIVACFLESEVADQALEMKNEMDDTTLHVAVRNGHLEVVKLLVQKHRVLLGLVNNRNESPLFLAVVRGFLEIAKFMLEGYSLVCSCEGTKGMTTLHAAVIHTNKELSRENLCWSAISRRLFKENRFMDEIDIMKLLLEKKKNFIRQTDEVGWSPLHYAAHLGHHEATKKILAVDDYVADQCDAEQSCALHIAAKNGYSDIIEEIIARRPDVYNLVDNKRRTMLHIAVQFGQAGVVKYILDKPKLESLINEPDKEGNTAFHLAASHPHYLIIDMLAADNRVDKGAMNNEFLKVIDIYHSKMAGCENFVMDSAMKKLKRTGGGRFHEFVVTRERTASNTRGSTDESTSDGGLSHRTASNTSTHGERNNIEVVMEAKDTRLKGVFKTNLLVAALIATVTFQAGMSPPGGFRAEGPPGAVFSSDFVFQLFSWTNGQAFYLSAAAVLLHALASIRRDYVVRLHLAKTSAFSIFSAIVLMMIAFSCSFYFADPGESSTYTTTIVLNFLPLFYFYSLRNTKKVWD